MRERKDEVLNNIQKIGLKYYEDILLRIPRDEIVNYEKVIQILFDEIKNETSTFEIVGSYRRGAKTSGDIDIIISDKNNDKSIFKKFIDILIESKLLIEILSRGNKKCLAISKLKGLPARRIDFMYSPPDEYPFALLYFTGSKEYNTVMRRRALDMGYTMNEHGFSIMSGKNKLNKLNKIFNSEKEVCDFLKIEYKEPTERIHGSCLVLFNKEKKTNKMVHENYPIEFIIKQFKKKGTSLTEKLGEPVLEEMLKKANEYYYILNKPLLTDSQYDVLREFVMTKYPNNKYASAGHAKLSIDAIKNK